MNSPPLGQPGVSHLLQLQCETKNDMFPVFSEHMGSIFVKELAFTLRVGYHSHHPTSEPQTNSDIEPCRGSTRLPTVLQ